MSIDGGKEKLTIGQRLKEERERLSLSQTSLGELFAVGRTVIRHYEENKTSPRADQLEKFGEIGADVIYILTGRRLSPGVMKSAASQPRDKLALAISALDLAEDDAEMLLALARRLGR